MPRKTKFFSLILVASLAGCSLESSMLFPDLEAPSATGIPFWSASVTDSNTSPGTLQWNEAVKRGYDISLYQIALGTSAGQSDILGWAPASSASAHTFTGLNLTNGETYFASVKAVDHFGKSGPTTTCSGITVLTDLPSFIIDFTTISSLPPAFRNGRTCSTSTTTGTYYDSSGVLQNAPINYLLRSETYDNASWTKTLATISADTALAPSLVISADKIVEAVAVGEHFVSQSITNLSVGAIYTFSVFAKASERNFLYLSLSNTAFSSDPFVVFNLASGTVHSFGNFPTDYDLVDMGNGWYRVSLTATAAATGTGTANIKLQDNFGQISYLGESDKGAFIFGAQLENSDEATTYTVTSSTPSCGARFDHDPTNCPAGECVRKGLLVETESSNQILQNSNFSSANWNKSNSTVLANSAMSPQGLPTASLLQESLDVSNTLHQISQDSLSIDASSKYTASIFVKPSGRTKLKLLIYRTSFSDGVESQYDLNLRTTSNTVASGMASQASASMQTLVNGWYRLELNGIISTSNDVATFTVKILDSSAVESYIGDGSSGIYLWGAQFEKNGRQTSPIATTTTAVTRYADFHTVYGISAWANDTAGTLYSEAIIGNNDNSVTHYPLSAILCPSATCSNNKIEIQVFKRQPVSLTTVSGITTFYSVFSGSGVTPTTILHNAVAYSTNNFRAAYNGTLSAADNSGALPSSLAEFRFSGHAWYRRFIYWPVRLTDKQIEAFTKP